MKDWIRIIEVLGLVLCLIGGTVAGFIMGKWEAGIFFLIFGHIAFGRREK